MPALYTDSNGRVVRRVNNPNADTSDADKEVDTLPNKPDVKPWVECNLYLTKSNGVEWRTSDPFEGLNLSDDEKLSLFKAVRENDFLEARNIVEKALSV